MVPLICTQCGGQLEAEEDKVFVAGDTVISGNSRVVIKRGDFW